MLHPSIYVPFEVVTSSIGPQIPIPSRKPRISQMNVDTRGYVDDSIQDSCVERGPDPAVSRPQMDQDYLSFNSTSK